jgi:cytidylate kinase
MADPVGTAPGRVMLPVLTISASYGAGGSVIAPTLALRLGLPLVDRLVTADVSDAADRSAHEGIEPPAPVEPAAGLARSGEGLSGDEQEVASGSRLFSYLARAAGAGVGAVTTPPMDIDTDDDLRLRAEKGLAPIRAGEGAVILGRAGAVVLAHRPRAFHVRLDGPAHRRRVVAAGIEGVTEDRAAQRLTRADRARELWVKRLYRADTTDPRWYHLWVDTTVLRMDDNIDLVEWAFGRFLSRGPGDGAG